MATMRCFWGHRESPGLPGFGARENMPSSARLNWSQSQNAQVFETVTVFYRWHPLAGQKLIVQGRINRNGERVLCRLPDGSVCSLPAWILRPESSRFILGKPLVGVDPRRELRDLLSTLQASAGCGKASLKVVPKEGIDETAEAKHAATTPLAAAGSAPSEAAGGQTKRSRERTDGTSSEGRRRKRRQPGRKETDQ